jgi:hypothetical protein
VLALLDTPFADAEWDKLDPLQRRQRTFDAVKRMLLRESQVQPLLLVFEDLHWLDSETQSFLEGLVESLPLSRMLVLVNYRPEYRDPWGDRPYYTRLRVDPLKATAPRACSTRCSGPTRPRAPQATARRAHRRQSRSSSRRASARLPKSARWSARAAPTARRVC